MNTPVPPPSNAPQAPLPPAANTAQITQLPSNVTTLTNGQVLNGTVIERLPTGQFSVQTDAGLLVLKSSAAPSLGARLALKIDVTTTRLLAQITLQGAPPVTAPAASTPFAAPVLDVANLTAGGNFIATVTKPGSVSPAIFGSEQQPVSTKPLSDLLNNLKNSSLFTRGGNRPVPSPSATPANLQSVNPLQPGTQVPLRVIAASGPNTLTASSPQQATATGNAAFSAIVTQSSANGQVTANGTIGDFTFQTRSGLPVGSNLLLQVSGTPQSPLPSAATPQSFLFGERWETLHSLLTSPAAAATQGPVQQAVPQPGTPLAASILFFMSALRLGDVRQWLGQEASRLLDRAGLLNQLIDDFAILQRFAADSAGNEWRLFLIPFLSDGQLQNLKLYVHDNPEDDAQSRAEKGQRFVIDVSFTKFGAFQFDGLARQKHFDLIVRTEHALAGFLEKGIANVFNDTVTALGLTGAISFKFDDPFVIEPLRAVHANTDQVVI